MKKLIYLSAFVLTTLLTISCSSDSDGSSTGGSSDVFVGNWKEIGYIYEGEYAPTENIGCDELIIKINSDGTGVTTQKNCGEAADVLNFIWEKRNASRYYIKDQNGIGGESEIIFSENNNRMTVYEGNSTNAGVYQRQ